MGYLLQEQVSNSRIERQRGESSGCLEVVCFKGTTFRRHRNSATQKVGRTFARGLKAATVFIVGGQTILQYAERDAEVRQSPEIDAACCMSLDQATLAAIR